MPDSTTVFTYHAIDDRTSVISVSPELFCRQMELLAEKGIRGISLEQALQPGQVPQRSVALTFDDGYLSVFQHVLPVMKALGFSGTVFIPTDFIGLNGQEAQKLNKDIDRDMMDWKKLEALKESGFEIAAHARTHPDLTRLSPEQLEEEIAGGKRCLEERLQSAVPSFAYPYGYYNKKVREVAARHFNYACTTELGHNRPGTDPLLLKRIDVYYLHKEARFLEAAEGGLGNWWKFRQGLREIKAAGRSNLWNRYRHRRDVPGPE